MSEAPSSSSARLYLEKQSRVWNFLCLTVKGGKENTEELDPVEETGWDALYRPHRDCAMTESGINCIISSPSSVREAPSCRNSESCFHNNKPWRSLLQEGSLQGGRQGGFEECAERDESEGGLQVEATEQNIRDVWSVMNKIPAFNRNQKLKSNVHTDRAFTPQQKVRKILKYFTFLTYCMSSLFQ